MAALDGMKAPPFALAGSDGRTHALGDYAGRTLVVYFYPKDDTPGCTLEACGFRDLHAELQRIDAALLGVSRDGLGSHDRFIAKFGLPFTLLSDPDGAMLRAYGAWGEKSLYGKKVEGVIRSTVVIGPDGTVLRHWPAVKKAGEHPQEVLEFLKAL
jgi:peroxiredoxin Q/BCP